MKITEADVVWVPAIDGAGTIRVERHGSGWRRTPGDRWIPAATAFDFGGKGDPLLSLFILFNTVTVRDGIPVQAAHKAFLAIDDYTKSISPDIKGGTQGKQDAAVAVTEFLILHHERPDA